MTTTGMRKAGALLAVGVVFAWPQPPAHANGAFPDSMGILLPTDRPSTIIASTNFGLLISEDDGASWGWVCEEAVGTMVSLYEMAVPPDDLLLAVSFSGVSYSADLGCTWNLAGGEIAGYFMTDVSPDAVDPLRSYALARHGAIRSVHESLDGAQTYGPPLLSSTDPQFLTGVENARSRPETLYVSLYNQIIGPAIVHPYVARSYDRGANWQLFDPGPDFDHWRNALIAVDPMNEKRVYLRMADVTYIPREALGIYDDDPEHGTGTLSRALEYPTLRGPITAFLRRSDGALIVAASGEAFISTDQGTTFQQWPNAPHLRGLGERNHVLYAVADNVTDGYAVARSSNDGASWEGLMRFQQLTGPKNCGNLPSICAGPWQTLRQRLGITQSDGGSDGGLDGGLDGGVDPGLDAGNDPSANGTPPTSPRSGCGEGASPDGAPWSVLSISLTVVAVRLLFRRRAR